MSRLSGPSHVGLHACISFLSIARFENSKKLSFLPGRGRVSASRPGWSLSAAAIQLYFRDAGDGDGQMTMDVHPQLVYYVPLASEVHGPVTAPNRAARMTSYIHSGKRLLNEQRAPLKLFQLKLFTQHGGRACTACNRATGSRSVFGVPPITTECAQQTVEATRFKSFLRCCPSAETDGRVSSQNRSNTCLPQSKSQESTRYKHSRE